MHQTECSNLIKKMNITSDAVIINQSDTCSYQILDNGNNKIDCYTVNERGLSKSRNTALLKSTGDLLCIADDDMVYSDSYEKDILEEFERNPKADAIIFYVKPINGREGNTNLKRTGRLGRYEYKEFCSVEIVVKKEKIYAHNIWFNAMFGSGAHYNCGEDSIFIKEMLDKGLRVYKSPIQIAVVDMSESTWFHGYTQELFFNKGALVAVNYPKLWRILIVFLSIKNSKRKLGSNKRIFELYSWYKAGALDLKSRY